MNEAEEWRPVVGFDGLFEGVYEVSNLGRVKRVLGGPGKVVGRILKPKIDKDGYPSYGLIHNLQRRDVRVSRLVCEAFHGPAPEGKPWALHRDDDKSRNTPENLYWGSPGENLLDCVRNGTHWEASKTHGIRGHPLDDENTYWQGRKRSCLTCRRRASRESYYRAKERREDDES